MSFDGVIALFECKGTTIFPIPQYFSPSFSSQPPIC